ncbi:unnamed protein product [Ectocarpus fasciculatus]
MKTPAKGGEGGGGDNANGGGSTGKKSTGGKSRTQGEAFKRVQDEQWVGGLKKGFDDNTYEGTFGQGGYGFKASEKLSKVRGKDFRHEKTKKKRGSYRGGEISMNSYSVKFDDSDG